MMRRLLPLTLVSSVLFSAPVLHAAPGSIAPVTLVLTVTGVAPALPDADKDGFPDWEKETASTTSSSTKGTYEFKSKYVTTKLTNAAFLAAMVERGVVADVNYSLVVAFDDEGAPFGFYLIRKGESTIITTPIDVTNHLYFGSMSDTFLTAMSLKETQLWNGEIWLPLSFSNSVSLKGPVQLGVAPLLEAFGMYSATLRYDAGKGVYLTTGAKITSIAGGYLDAEENEQPITVEGSINFAAGKAVDIAIFPRPE